MQKNKRELLTENLTEDETLLFAEGFDDAIIGVLDGVVVYSYVGCILECVLCMGIQSIEDAIEYIDFNVVGAYVGDKTPIFVDDMALRYDELEQVHNELKGVG
jgi:hypothetical protein